MKAEEKQNEQISQNQGYDFLRFKHPFWANIFDLFRFKTEPNINEVLNQIPLFENLNKKDFKTISMLLHEREYEPEEYIFRMHQPGAAMFIVETGKVEVIHETEHGEFKLAQLQEGEFFGELALLDDSPRSASAVARNRSRLLAIFRADLDKLLLSQPGVGGKIMKQLAIIIGMRLKATNEQLSQIRQEEDSWTERT